MNPLDLKFSRKQGQVFVRELNKRVNKYFKDNKISKTGNGKLYIKTIVMLSLYVVPYFLLMFGNFNVGLQFVLFVIAGVGMAGVGMNVMHDANHGSFSNKTWVNKMMGGTMYFLAGNVYNWKVQHNLLHHSYTNIYGYDEDIDVNGIMRFSEHIKWRKFHKYQHIYSIFLYGLLTFNWAITSDFRQTNRYLKKKLSYGKFPNPTLQWISMIAAKIMYISIWFIIPIFIINMKIWVLLLGFFVMHFVSGLILSVVFQLAHVVEDSDMLVPDESGQMQNSWMVHQLFTTANFATKNKIVSWFTGGLNFQVEHHIFPHISHVHYSKIADIVKKTTKEFELPYLEYKTTRAAILAHFRHLKNLGLRPVTGT